MFAAAPDLRSSWRQYGRIRPPKVGHGPLLQVPLPSPVCLAIQLRTIENKEDQPSYQPDMRIGSFNCGCDLQIRFPHYSGHLPNSRWSLRRDGYLHALDEVQVFAAVWLRTSHIRCRNALLERIPRSLKAPFIRNANQTTWRHHNLVSPRFDMRVRVVPAHWWCVFRVKHWHIPTSSASATRSSIPALPERTSMDR